MSKSNKHFKRRLSLFLVFVLAFGSVVSVSAEELSQRNYSAKEDISYENYRLADLPEVIANSILTTDTTPVEIINQDTDDIYSITVKNSDGTNTLHIFQTPIKYVDGNSVKLKDTAINSSTKRISMFDTYAYESGDNEIKGYFPEHISDGVKVEYDDYSVTLTPMPDIDLSNSEVKATSTVARVGNSVAYTDVFGENVSLEYFSTLNGVKENIILAEYSGKNTFSFIIDTDGLVPEKMSGDSIPLLDPETGEMKLYIGQINAKDSYTGDNENDDTHFTLYNSLELEQIGNKADVYKLTIVVDKEFLESETTVYPVTIDPTVSMAATNMSDAPVFSGYPTRNYYTNEYNMVGYHGSSYKEAISYVKLNTLSSYKYINPQKINLAYYRVYEGSGKTSTATINLYDTVSTWNDTTITYNNKPSFAGNAASSQTISSSGWYLFSITSLFKNWLQGTLGEGGFSHNYGFALSASTTGVSSRHFCSANSANYLPTIVVQYSEDTSIADGAYYIKSKYSNLYLDTEQNASANGNVIQYSFHGDNNQVWVVRYQSDGYYKLYSPWYNETKCLDVTSNPTQNGSNVDVYNDGDGDYLLFKLVSNNDGSYRIISKWSGNQKVLDVCGPSTAATANIQIWEYLNVDQQKWVFERKLDGKNSYTDTITSMPLSNTYEQAVADSNSSYESLSFFNLSPEMQNQYYSIYSSARNAALAAANQYPLASQMLVHFLDNTGDEFIIPPNYINEATEIHNQVLSLQNEIDTVYRYFYSAGHEVAFGRRLCMDGNIGSDNTDWKLAVNRCELWAKGRIKRVNGNDQLIKEIHVRDYYDWQSNYAGTLISLTSSFLHDLHMLGLAKEYPVSGVYTVNEVL